MENRVAEARSEIPRAAPYGRRFNGDGDSNPTHSVVHNRNSTFGEPLSDYNAREQAWQVYGQRNAASKVWFNPRGVRGTARLSGVL